MRKLVASLLLVAAGGLAAADGPAPAMTIDDLPEAVRAAVLKQADGATLELAPHAGDWRLRVANPCGGLHADDASRVFQRFWRADAARGEGHAGLGLAIVRRLAELSGCHVAVAIADGRFTVTLDVPARGPSMPACPPTENPSTAS